MGLSREDKIISFVCLLGIALIAFIWVWVFKWGVPLVKHIHQIK